MIVEKVTVTTTPTTLKALIETARGSGVTSKATDMTIRYNEDETALVYMSDPNTSAANRALVLDAQTEEIVQFTAPIFNLEKVLLNTNSGTVEVDLIISQKVI